MKYLIPIVLILHGLIHALGFAKAYFPTRIVQLENNISKPMGWIWLLTGITFITCGILFKYSRVWWAAGLVAILVSQLLIINAWSDARYGTILNVLLLTLCLIQLFEWKYENLFRNDVITATKDRIHSPILTDADITHLPYPVQKYIRLTGAIDKPRIKNFSLKFEGKIRSDSQSAWMPCTTEQVNLIDPPTRLFFMKANMKQLPVTGYHAYRGGTATMDIRLLSLATVQHQAGPIMDVAETVTWLNDLCLFAPGVLIDERFQWHEIDSLTAKVTFTYKDITVGATLQFNIDGGLADFISDDRYRIVSEADQKRMRFSTPIKEYVTINGFQVPYRAQAVWHPTERDSFVYGEFLCTDIQYNVQSSIR